jgi:hypothetical protein
VGQLILHLRNEDVELYVNNDVIAKAGLAIFQRYNKSRCENPGFSLLFNLRTSKLMQMEVIIVRDNGKSIQYVPVDFASRCNSGELKDFASNAR